MQGGCCGISNFTDFRNAKMFNENKTQGQSIPVSCCKLNGDPLNFDPIDSSCIRNPSDGNSYWRQVKFQYTK